MIVRHASLARRFAYQFHHKRYDFELGERRTTASAFDLFPLGARFLKLAMPDAAPEPVCQIAIAPARYISMTSSPPKDAAAFSTCLNVAAASRI